ncbi:MAG: DUF1934 domain-containing protein [Clostridia bacterium]|nr:DUF1934 domain-containing protein [Clostridia bacterium]
MQVKIETKTIQTIEGKQEIIKQSGNGTIEKYEKGTILSWDVVEENLHFKMTILENKILLKNQTQNMIFELGKTTKSQIQTQHGNLNLNITTKHIEIVKDKQIKKIHLIYDIQIENMDSYENEIEINIK